MNLRVATWFAISALFALPFGCGDDGDGGDSEGGESVVVGEGDSECIGPDPPVLGKVLAQPTESLGAFDLAYRLCDLEISEPELADGEDGCESLTVKPAVTVAATTAVEATIRSVCTYDDVGGLSITLPGDQNALPALALSLPARGEESLVDCYVISPQDSSSGDITIAFPVHTQQDYSTHDAATTASPLFTGPCDLKISEDTRTQHGTGFRVSGTFVCRGLAGQGSAELVLPPGKLYRYDLSDGSFSVDCWYE